MKPIRTHTIIVTSMTELCRQMRREDIEIVSMMPIKGIADEDIIKLEFKRKHIEEEA